MMRDIFPGHFQKTSAEIEKIWNEAFFMLDANILLNLYRYSESTKKDFLKILSNPKIRKRLWLPHRAAEEYLENRSSVISKQSKSYIQMIDSIKTFKSNLDNKRQHPFVTDKLKYKVDQVLDSLMDELKQSHNEHEFRHTDDPIKDEIDGLIGPQVTERYDDDRLKKIFSDGEKRYLESIPPGYKDSDKETGDGTFSDKIRVYGDLILWNQIIDFAEYNKANIIFVTDDKKEDWWSIASGKTVGPRPELIDEFERKTNQFILVYQADRFFEYSSNFLKQNVDPASKDEISDLTKRKYRIESEKERLENIKNNTLRLSAIIKELRARMTKLEELKMNLAGNLKHLKVYGDEKMIQETELKLKELDFELTNLYQQYADARAKHDMHDMYIVSFENGETIYKNNE